MVTYLQDDLPTFRDASHLKTVLYCIIYCTCNVFSPWNCVSSVASSLVARWKQRPYTSRTWRRLTGSESRNLGPAPAPRPLLARLLWTRAAAAA